MKRLLNYVLIIFCLATGFFVTFSFAKAATYNPEKIFYVSQNNAEAGVKSIIVNHKKIDIVAPQMYAATAEFSLVGKLGPKLKKAIKDYNLKVMPLIVNSGFKRSVIDALLRSEVGQTKIIEAMIKEAKAQKYIGWQFDFENISYLDKDLFSAFVEKTYAEFKKNNLIFSVAAVARWSDFEDTVAFRDWSGVYDYKRIADASDFVSYMTYDDPESVGPVASLAFMDRCLKYVEDKIPANKLSLGVPLYYWVWNMDTAKKVGSGLYKNAYKIMEDFVVSAGFNKDLGTAWLTYINKGKRYVIWYENKQSVLAKIELAEGKNLRGFSAWVLGGEDPDIWKVLIPTSTKILTKN